MLVPLSYHCSALGIYMFLNCKNFKCFEVSSKLRMITISKIIGNQCCNYLTDILIGYFWFSFIFQFLNTKLEKGTLSSLSVRLCWSAWCCELVLCEEKCTVGNLQNWFLLAALGWHSCILHPFENMFYYFILLCWAIGNWFSQTI